MHLSEHLLPLLKTIGDTVDLGFDSSRGQLFNFGMKVEISKYNSKSKTVRNHKANSKSKTIHNHKLCEQNVDVIPNLFMMFFKTGLSNMDLS